MTLCSLWGGRLLVNHLLEHNFLSDVQLQSLLDALDRVPGLWTSLREGTHFQ